jgi:hypothetical protein
VISPLSYLQYLLPLVVDGVTHGIPRRCYHTAWICIIFHTRIFYAKVSDIFENASSNLKSLLFCVPASSVSTLISAFLINPEYLP